MADDQVPSGEPGSAGGYQTVQRMMEAGMPPIEAQRWEARTQSKMLESGMPPDDIAKYFGQSEPDMRRFRAEVEAGFAHIGSTEGVHYEQFATDPVRMFGAGLQHSVQGLATAKPTLTPDDSSVAGRVSYGLGQQFGDTNAQIGAFVGTSYATANPIAGWAAAGGLPEGYRQIMMDHYQHDDPSAPPPTFQQFWDRAVPIVVNTSEAAVVSGVSGPAGGAVGNVVSRTAAAPLAGVANLSTQVAAGTTIGAALRGQIPSPDDFAVGAVTMLGLAGAGKLAETTGRFVPNDTGQRVIRNLQDIYAATGMKPDELVRLAQTDQVLRGELLAPNAAGGERVTPLIDQIRPPEPKPFIPERVSVPEQGQETEVVKPETLGLVRKLEGSADDAVSLAGAIGRYQIMPGTARAYGFDPAQLKDPAYNERVATAILSDLSRKFNGDLPAMLVAYNAGPNRARAWIAGGRVIGDLPLETQKYLEHAERLGQIQIGANQQQVTRQLQLQGDTRSPEPPLGTIAKIEEPLSPPPPPPPPEGPEITPPEPEPPKITDQRMLLNEDMLADKALDIVGEKKVPPSFNPRMMLREFQSQLSPARDLDRKTGLDPSQIGIEDMLRQVLGASGRVNQFYKEGVLDPLGGPDNSVGLKNDNSVAKALVAVKEDGGDIKGFLAYRLYARALEKAKQGIDTGVDVDDAQRFMSLPGVADKYARGAAIMAENKAGLIDYGRDSGLFSPEQAQTIKDNNVFHIVMRRLIDPDYNPPRPGAVLGVRNPIKVMEGSNRQIVNPFTTEIDNAHTIIGMADRNRAIGNIIGLIEQHNATAIPEKQIAVRQIAAPGKADSALNGQILDENGQPIPDEMKAALEPFLAASTVQSRLAQGDFPYFRNGQMEIWHADDPDLAQLFRMQWPGKMNPVAQLLTKFAGLERAGIIANPTFGFSAMFHGQVAASVLSREGPILPFSDVFRASTLALTGRFKEEMGDWERNGGSNVALSDIDQNYLAKDIEHVFDKTGTTSAIWNTVRHPLDAWRSVLHMVDASARVGAFNRLKESGFNPVKAASLSRTMYLDHAEGFNASWVNTMSKMVPFMRVGFKDLEQFGQAMQDRPLSTMLKGAVLITLPVLVNYALNWLYDRSLPEDRASERYSELPQWERDMYLITPPINGTRLKIRMPYVSGFAFGTLPHRFLDYTAGQDPHAFDGAAKELVDQYVPPFMPSAMTPIVENATDHKFLTDRPLIPSALEHNSPPMQYTPDTSETSKAISAALGPAGANVVGVSPIVLDNYANQWLGTLPMRLLKTLESTYKVGRPAEMADNPFVGSLFARSPAGNSASIERFYDRLHTVSEARADLRLALQRQDPREIQSSASLQAFIRMTNLQKSMNNQRAVLDAIYHNADMTDAEKRKWTDSITTNMIHLAQMGTTVLDQLDKR